MDGFDHVSRDPTRSAMELIVSAADMTEAPAQPGAFGTLSCFRFHFKPITGRTLAREMHPSNARKRDLDPWFAVLDRIEHGVVPPVQVGKVEWTSAIVDWMGPPRGEPFIFLVSGRNVLPGRIRRCIASMLRQKGPRWGAILIDDVSEPVIAEHFEMPCGSLGERCAVIRNSRRRGLFANMVTAIRLACDDPGSIVVTLIHPPKSEGVGRRG